MKLAQLVGTVPVLSTTVCLFMLDHWCSIPATNDMKSYSTGCTGVNMEATKANALAYYNVERYNRNLPSVDKLPEGTVFREIKATE
jgi:hypothetical protein